MAAGLALAGPVWVRTPASATAFSNATPIVLSRPGPPAGCPDRCPSERAGPYPSGIPVNGQTGTLTDVNVLLLGITYEHNGLADADVLLVAPGGRSVMLMSDACGDNDTPNPVTKAINLSFDDQAAAALPADGACKAGNFRPLDDDNDGEVAFHQPDEFPEGPSAPARTLPLSALNGIDPNGTWNLFVVDDSPNEPDPNGRAGQIEGGWLIDVSTSPGHLPAPTVPDSTPPSPEGTAAGAGGSTSGASGAAGGNATSGGSATGGADGTSGANGAPGTEGTDTPGGPEGSADETGRFGALADTDDGSGDIVLWVVGGFLVVGAISLVGMSRSGGGRFRRR